MCANSIASCDLLLLCKHAYQTRLGLILPDAAETIERESTPRSGQPLVYFIAELPTLDKVRIAWKRDVRERRRRSFGAFWWMCQWEKITSAHIPVPGGR